MEGRIKRIHLLERYANISAFGILSSYAQGIVGYVPCRHLCLRQFCCQRTGNTSAAGAYVENTQWLFTTLVVSFFRFTLHYPLTEFVGLGSWYEHSRLHMEGSAAKRCFAQHILYRFARQQALLQHQHLCFIPHFSANHIRH